MPELEAALDSESWDWLTENFPLLATALQAEVKRNATPEEIGRFVMRHTQRPNLSMRMRQAAQHLAAVKKE